MTWLVSQNPPMTAIYICMVIWWLTFRLSYWKHGPDCMPRAIFQMCIIPDALVMVLLQNVMACIMILPSMLIINYSKHLFPWMVFVTSWHLLDHVGQASGLFILQPASATNLFLLWAPFKAGKFVCHPVGRSKQYSQRWNVIFCLRNGEQLTRNSVSFLLVECTRYKLSFTFGGYSSMPQTPELP